MDPLSGLRRKNAAAAPTKNGAAGLPLVLPEVQTGEHHQCAEFSNRDHKSARRKDAVLTAISVVMRCIFFRRKSLKQNEYSHDQKKSIRNKPSIRRPKESLGSG